jgi:hypothetical protein
MKNLGVLLISAFVLYHSPAFAGLECGAEVAKVVGIWGPEAKQVAEKSIRAGYTQFKVITPKGGVAQVSETAIGKYRFPTIHQKKGSKDNVRISLDPSGNCGIGVATFYSYDAKGAQSQVSVTGRECHHFSAYSAAQTQSHGDEFSHSDEDNQAVKNLIIRTFKAKKPPVVLSDALAQRVRDNCRNSSEVGKLSYDSEGRNNASWQQYLRNLQNDMPDEERALKAKD